MMLQDWVEGINKEILYKRLSDKYNDQTLNLEESKTFIGLLIQQNKRAVSSLRNAVELMHKLKRQNESNEVIVYHKMVRE